jgi:hypothetical protein
MANPKHIIESDVLRIAIAVRSEARRVRESAKVVRSNASTLLDFTTSSLEISSAIFIAAHVRASG